MQDKRNDAGLGIFVCIALMLGALVWACLSDPELKARRNGTWEPPSGSSQTSNSIEDEGWHFNRLNGQWNPGLWTDAQHAILFDD